MRRKKGQSWETCEALHEVSIANIEQVVSFSGCTFGISEVDNQGPDEEVHHSRY